MTQALTLISHHTCPYVQRAAIVLAEKGVAFERVNVDLTAKPEWFLAISPLGKVPLLKVRSDTGGDAVLFESNVICEYLEETQPGEPLHPTDPLDRARHRGWMEFGSALLVDLWGIQTAPTDAEFEAKRNTLASKLDRVEAEIGEGPFFAGAHFSLVDAVFAPVFRTISAIETVSGIALLADHPKTAAWRSVLEARASVAAAAPADYIERMEAVLRRHDGYLARRVAERTAA